MRLDKTKRSRSQLHLRLFSVLTLFFSVFFGPASSEKFTENEVKAVYLFNFTSFISWPEASFNNRSDPFTYCSLGEEGGVTKALKEISLGEKVSERSIKFKNIIQIADIKNCQVLYLSKQHRSNIAVILHALHKRPILTVSDIKGFAKQGGAIEFSTKDGRMKLLINVSKTKDSQLNISSKLLRIADLINTPSNGGEAW